jgi:hypothetical protein
MIFQRLLAVSRRQERGSTKSNVASGTQLHVQL